MRVQAKPLNQYPWFIRLFFAKQKRTYGAVLDPGLLWARSKWVFTTVALLYGALNRKSSPLDPALRSMVTVRISQINHCAFCVDVNGATLEKRKVDEEKILALQGWRHSTLFTPIERAALEYAEAVTYTDGDITKAILTALRAHFDDDAIVELTGLIAFQNMSSKFNAALDIPPQGFCQLPDLGMDT
ncbi:MAG: carboxymuconolactone decarboxylase family protein [Rhodobacteraceae bacterium]|nr:carboxymuconolactone decarboxylase family protein [Paracoccaceae bacterium]